MNFLALIIILPFAMLVGWIVQSAFNLLYSVLLVASAGFCALFWIASRVFNFAGFGPVSSVLLVMLIIWGIFTVEEYFDR
jgi:hypothetical protein